MSEVINTRVPESVAHSIAVLATEEHTDRATFVRQLLVAGLEEKQLQRALRKYQSGEITLGKAAQMVRFPLRKMMIIAAERGIPFQYSLRDLRRDADAGK